MNPDQMREFLNQNIYYVVAGGVAIGLVLGAIPLALSIKRKKAKLGFIGLVLSALMGGLSPILSLIVAGIFCFLVLKKTSASETTTDAPAPPAE